MSEQNAPAAAATAPAPAKKRQRTAKPAAEGVTVKQIESLLEATEQRLGAHLAAHVTAEKDARERGHTELKNEIATDRELRKRKDAEIQQRLDQIPTVVAGVLRDNVPALVLQTIEANPRAITHTFWRQTGKAIVELPLLPFRALHTAFKGHQAPAASPAPKAAAAQA